MHYSPVGFSKNGLPTMETIDPALRDTMGDTELMSEGDVTRINKMNGLKCKK
jgi:hypothetical protein